MKYVKYNLLYEAKDSLTEINMNINSHCTILMMYMQNLDDNMLSKYILEVFEIIFFKCCCPKTEI